MTRRRGRRRHPRDRVHLVVDVDGEPVRSSWTGEPSEEQVEVFRELVRAAKKKLAEGVDGGE